MSCAVGLLSQGRTVVMLDGGADLESHRAEGLVTLRTAGPDSWDESLLSFLKDGMQAGVDGIPLKMAYGSDFPYRKMPGAPAIEGRGVNTKYSLGKGGFSTVWGAAVLPFRQADMAGWPVSAHALAPHYRAVLDFMPVAQQQDALGELFPTFRETRSMPMSPQAAALEKALHSKKQLLERKGIHFGRSRLAVNVTGNDAGLKAESSCVECGLCMYGCPYGLIYSTAQTLELLKQNPLFTYTPGYVVRRLEERAEGVRLHVTRTDGTESTIDASRVYVGAGVLSTAALILRSLGEYEQEITFRESHYFLLPMLRLAGTPGFTRRDVHTLAQLFIEVLDQSISPVTIHLQTYTYNDLFETPIAEKLGPLRHAFPMKSFLSRLFLFQGYLHSSHSSRTSARLHRRDGDDVLQLTPLLQQETTATVSKLVRKLNRERSLTGMAPLTPLMRHGEPGRGFHTGCSFPMSAAPAGLESDVLGRVQGFRRVHVVDASVLPTIPATTITFTVMANAHRIGVEAALLDSEGERANTPPEDTGQAAFTPEDTASPKMVVAVTGASGYVGSRLAAALSGTLRVVPLGRNADAEGIRWSLSDETRVAADLRSRGARTLLHAAWDFTRPKPSENWRVNVEGSRRLFENAIQAGVDRIVFLSTISSFEGAQSEYGKSKLAVERLALDLGGTVIRPGLVWGERPGGMFDSLRSQVAKGGVVPLIGDGSYPQYLVHEEDLAAIVVRAVAGEFAGRVLTVAHSKPWPIRDLILRLAQEQGRKIRFLPVPWRLVYGGLKSAESLGVRMSFRSDSLKSMVYQNPAPDFASVHPLREFV
jgi:nucleoside-diphosphate-sugar epimerase/choline dehydrogenase-like flavoprotein